MLYYIRRINSDGSKTAYITENKNIASKLERGEKPLRFRNLSLKDIIARIKFEKPAIDVKTDSRYPSTVVSQDVSSWNTYFRKMIKILQLDEFDPRRAQWEEERKRYLQILDKEKKGN